MTTQILSPVPRAVPDPLYLNSLPREHGRCWADAILGVVDSTPQQLSEAVFNAQYPDSPDVPIPANWTAPRGLDPWLLSGVLFQATVLEVLPCRGGGESPTRFAELAEDGIYLVGGEGSGVGHLSGMAIRAGRVVEYADNGFAHGRVDVKSLWERPILDAPINYPPVQWYWKVDRLVSAQVRREEAERRLLRMPTSLTAVQWMASLYFLLDASKSIMAVRRQCRLPRPLW